jgi:hypothetical protein
MSIDELWPDIDMLDEIIREGPSAISIPEVRLHERSRKQRSRKLRNVRDASARELC